MSLDDQLDEAFKSLGESMGMKGRALETFVGGHSPRQREGFDGMVDAFRGLGMSETSAKVAAIGHHGSEREAREVFDTGSARPGEPEPESVATAIGVLSEAYERFHGFTAAEATRHARGEAAKVGVMYGPAVVAGRLRELAQALNAAPAGKGRVTPPPSAAAASAGLPRGFKLAPTPTEARERM